MPVADTPGNRGESTDTPIPKPSATGDDGTIAEGGGPAGSRTPSRVAPLRQCGRCRLYFPVAPGTDPLELADWWACPKCAGTLLPEQHRSVEPTTDPDAPPP